MSEADKTPPELPVGLVYPCEFPLKIIVRPDTETEARIVALVRSQIDADAMLDVTRRASSGGKYLSLTVNFVAADAVHLQQVIDLITQDPGVVLAL